MRAVDLDQKTRTYSGFVHPRTVTRLLELGHADEVELQAGRGDWFCAEGWAHHLGGQGRHAEALQVLAPYIATGWWTAARAAAELLEEWGRAGEAITLARPYAEAGDRNALEFFGRLLTRNGHAGEAFDLLVPHVKDWFLARPLAAAAEVAGREEEVVVLLSTCVEAGPPCGNRACTSHQFEPFNAIALIAEIRERQGRVDEAIALLHARPFAVNNTDHLADLLARHDRIGELVAYAHAESHGTAARVLAELLEERGDVEGAIAVYRQLGGPIHRRIGAAVRLAPLLVRHGRIDEATQVLRDLADEHPEDWAFATLRDHYIEQGHPEQALAYLDALRDRPYEQEWEFFHLRIPLLVACGRPDEALEQARAHPDANTWYGAESIAGLLVDAGRVEDAIAVLRLHAPDSFALAEYLIDLGRIKEAVAVFHQRPTPTPVSSSTRTEDPPANEPPF